MFSYGLSEREAGSDTAGMKTRAVATATTGCYRAEVVDHQRRRLEVLHGARRHRPGRQARQQRHGVRAPEDDDGFTFGEKERKLGIKGSPTRELFFDKIRVGDDRRVGEVGPG